MIYDDVYSILHTAAGLASSALALANLFLPLLPLSMFIVYEYKTSRSIGELVGDVLEYLVGLASGYSIFFSRL